MLELLYPRSCIVCKKRLLSQEQFICFSCWNDLPLIPIKENRIIKLEQIFWGRVEIDRVVALFSYKSGSPYQNIIRAIKYGEQKKLGVEMGRRLAQHIKEHHLLSDIDMIIPIPLHQKKFKKRGFNQSERIAMGVSQIIDIEVCIDVLKRIKHTSTQTKKSKYERWNNVKDAFNIVDAEKLINKHILIIDDVLTTGSTIEACVREILKIDGTKVSVATLGAAE